MVDFNRDVWAITDHRLAVIDAAMSDDDPISRSADEYLVAERLDDARCRIIFLKAALPELILTEASNASTQWLHEVTDAIRGIDA